MSREPQIPRLGLKPSLGMTIHKDLDAALKGGSTNLAAIH